MGISSRPVNEKYNTDELRFTRQELIPGKKETADAVGYDIYPAFKIDGPVYTGFESLADWIIAQGGNIIIDGYSGVYWDSFIDSLNNSLLNKGVNAKLTNISQAMKPAPVIDDMIAPYLGGDDPLFGKLYEGSLVDFFDIETMGGLKPVNGSINIIYGCGASLAGWQGALVYTDVPKNEIQFRSRANGLRNLGGQVAADPKVQYKRCYFIDWPVLNQHKKGLLKLIDIYVDEQRITEISWAHGQVIRQALDGMARNMFRARPWFEPGIWGGSWIKDNIKGLNMDVENYAWSFELISPENGILLEHNGKMLEVSFDMLMFNNNEGVLGKAAKRFGDKFPIRFDFLDTFDGGELSLQCHPTVAYTKEHFGEDFTQDETYYILDALPDAKVYLGFNEDIDKQEFRTVLDSSFINKERVEVEKYVQTFSAKKHDLFLIPNGTVHCSGKNNMVLEISATPYIFTFKMYDWLRLDLNKKPRTLNIARAFDNLDFGRKGNVVTDTLLSKQTVAKQGADWQLIELSTHPDHFYAVERFEFDTVIEEQTNGQCHVLSLVEGQTILVKTNGLEQVIHYAETFIIPADARHYTLTNTGKTKAKVIKAFVKDSCC